MRHVVIRLALLLLFVAVTTALLLRETVIWFNMPSRTRFPVRGVDVSNHNGAIDWARVAGEGFRFALIKATEGGDFRDARFAENWEGARAAGLVPGAYHFFTFCRPPAEQAANFLAVVPSVSPALPPVVDVEFGGNCAARPTDLAGDLRVFRDALVAGGLRAPIVYTTREVLDAYTLDDGERWLRDVFREPAGPWRFWQYGYDRHVDGIVGLVDVDVFGGTEAEFASLISGEQPRVDHTTDPGAPAEVTEVHRGMAKLDPTVELDLRLRNPGDAPRWYVFQESGDPVPETGELMSGEPRLPSWEVLAAGAGKATFFNLGGFQVIRVPAHADLTLLGWRLMSDADETTWTLRVTVADAIQVDGDPLEARFPEALSEAGTYEVRGESGYDERDPAARARAWNRRVTTAHADVRESWVWRLDGTGEAWSRCSPTTPACATPVRPRFVGPLAESLATRITTLPDDALLAWLRAEKTQTLAHESGGSAWRLLDQGDILYLVLEGGKRRVTMWNELDPVVPGRVTSGFDDRAWVWWEGWDVRDGTLVRGQGGAVLLREDGWRALIPPGVHRQVINGGIPTNYLDGVAALDGPIRLKGAMVSQVLAPLLEAWPVQDCYLYARNNFAEPEILHTPHSASESLYRSGGEPLLMGHVELRVDVAADGVIQRATAAGLSSRRLRACMAEQVPKRWTLAPSFDGRPYRVDTTWLLRPDYGD